MSADRPSSRTPERVAGDSRAKPADQIASPATLVKTFAAAIAVLVASLLVLLHATGGGQSFTTETLRRQHISQQAELIPAFDVTLGNGQRTTLKAVLAPGGRSGWLILYTYAARRCACRSAQFISNSRPKLRRVACKAKSGCCRSVLTRPTTAPQRWLTTPSGWA